MSHTEFQQAPKLIFHPPEGAQLSCFFGHRRNRTFFNVSSDDSPCTLRVLLCICAFCIWFHVHTSASVSLCRILVSLRRSFSNFFFRSGYLSPNLCEEVPRYCQKKASGTSARLSCWLFGYTIHRFVYIDVTL